MKWNGELLEAVLLVCGEFRVHGRSFQEWSSGEMPWGSSRPDNCVSACFVYNQRRNHDNQAQPGHRGTKLSVKERLRNSRDEAVSQLRIERERNVKLCGRLQEYERMSV
jgi:hypothetical protein